LLSLKMWSISLEPSTFLPILDLLFSRECFELPMRLCWKETLRLFSICLTSSSLLLLAVFGMIFFILIMSATCAQF
jgi:hypothetical protein